MRKFNIGFLAMLVLLLSLAFSAGDVLAAKRMGGGKSVGQQSSNVSKREAAPAARELAFETLPGTGPYPV